MNDIDRSPPAPARDVPVSLEILLGALTAIAPLSIDMYIPAFSAIGADLNVSSASVQLTLASYFAGFALGQLVVGPLVDRLGRKKPLLVGLALYIVASLGCAMARSVEALAVLRALQAIAGAFAVVVPRAVVRDIAMGSAAARMFSRLMLVMGVAPIVAPLLGARLLTLSGWPAIFVVLAVCGALMFVAVVKILPDAPGRASAGFPVGALVRDPDFVRFTLAGAFAQGGMFAYIAGSPFVLIELHHVPAEKYGYFFGMNAFGLIVASQVNRRLLTGRSPRDVVRWSTRYSLITGVVVLVIGAAPLGGLWPLAIALFLFISSLGLVFPNTGALALENHGERAGVASAVLGFTQFATAAAAASLLTALHDGSSRPMSLIVGGCAVISWLLVETQRG